MNQQNLIDDKYILVKYCTHIVNRLKVDFIVFDTYSISICSILIIDILIVFSHCICILLAFLLLSRGLSRPILAVFSHCICGRSHQYYLAFFCHVRPAPRRIPLLSQVPTREKGANPRELIANRSRKSALIDSSQLPDPNPEPRHEITPPSPPRRGLGGSRDRERRRCRGWGSTRRWRSRCRRR
jgi:hypothetical protein